MKRISLALVIIALAFPAFRQVEARTGVSIDFFYNNLGNDGSWIYAGEYGYAWQPNVAVSNANWRPYTEGSWAYTDVGWTWVSAERFGWATYHYGRWARIRGAGWVWVPGRKWAPAWVSWRTGGDYIGWAPLPPRHAGGREVVYAGGSIGGRVDIEFNIGPSYYNFVDLRYIGEPRLHERILAPAQNVTYINKTVNVTNITYKNKTVINNGPDINKVSAYSTHPVQRLKLKRNADADLNAAAQSGSLTRVEGDQLVVAAPENFGEARKASAPKEVKKIEKPEVEDGWSDIPDQKAKAELQDKMKKEDARKVPPPEIQPTNPAALSGESAAPGSNGAGADDPAAATRKGKGKSAQTDQQVGTATEADPASDEASPGGKVKGGKGKGKNKRAETDQAAPAADAAQAGAETSSAEPTVTPGSEARKGKGRKASRPAPGSSVSGAPATTPAANPPARQGKPGKQKTERTNEDASGPAREVAPTQSVAPREPQQTDQSRGQKQQQASPQRGPSAGEAAPAPSDESKLGKRKKKKGAEETPSPAPSPAPGQ